ncbi:E3 ubiquitin-protein ligase TRIM11-like [Mauremys mutica]|uniref:E3 ubiquitin-protein ligase TRIM11-like n=1 Tax=Mauremys mutica TaxID=74926 RepID=UPI001D169E55|nr:E3 ubiquitin-protein ligase TRIM11-like [Mauremys mutica]
MAAANPAQQLLGELTCSVCRDYFKDPVSLDCGHHFCQACITQCWEGSTTNFRCPECRETFSQRNFKANRQLRNIVEASRKLTLELTKEPEVGTVCGKHQRALDVFCQEDQTPICLVCHLSRDHRDHTVVPIEEAAEDYKDQIRSRLESLKKNREEILSFKLSGENKSQELLKQLETEKQKIVSEFQQLRQFLEEQERLRLAQLEELNKEIEKGRAEYVAKLSEELSSFSSLISEMEQKCQQPASEFLQDIKGTVSSFQPLLLVLPLFANLRIPLVPNSLSSRLRLEKANVTLDPDTAHPELTVSADRRSVRWGDTRQHLRNNPERFDTAPCVLGCEGFTSGRHYWEVEAEAGVGWGVCAVGVARESVSRKGRISPNPEQGIWAHTSPVQRIRFLRFPPSRAPRRIRVYLDYEQGQVAIFDAGTGDPIGTFPPASFAGERIRPFFQAGVWALGRSSCSVRLL